MVKRDNFKKENLSRNAMELFEDVKKDIEESKKRMEKKRAKFDEVNKNGAMLSGKRFIL